jgi:periplasmic protein TonB
VPYRRKLGSHADFSPRGLPRECAFYGSAMVERNFFLSLVSIIQRSRDLADRIPPGDAVDPLFRHPPGKVPMRDEGFLDGCLVDGEVGVQRRRSSTRQRALAAALLFEAAIISGLALWPLLTPATPLPELVVLTPVPFGGEMARPRPVRPSAPAPRRSATIIAPDFSQPRVSASVMRTTSAQDTAPPIIGTLGPPMPPGPPGGFGNELGSVLPPKPVGPAVRVIRRSESVQESQLISRVIPTYPQIARVARVSGTVELLVLVGRDGRVLSVEVLSGSPLLAAAAKQAVEQWRYRPAILDGQAVEVQARVTMNFVLDE